MIFSRPISLTVKPSRRLIAFILLSHCAAVIALLYANLPGIVDVIGVGTVSASLMWSLRQYFLHIPTKLQYIDGQWSMVQKGDQMLITLCGDIVVLPFLIVVQYRDISGKKSHLVLLQDSANADELRQLRVTLRLVV